MKHTKEFYETLWETINDFIQDTDYQSCGEEWHDQDECTFGYCEDKGNELCGQLEEHTVLKNLTFEEWEILQNDITDLIIHQMYHDTKSEFGPASMSDGVLKLIKKVVEN